MPFISLMRHIANSETRLVFVLGSKHKYTIYLHYRLKCSKTQTQTQHFTGLYCDSLVPVFEFHIHTVHRYTAIRHGEGQEEVVNPREQAFRGDANTSRADRKYCRTHAAISLPCLVWWFRRRSQRPEFSRSYRTTFIQWKTTLARNYHSRFVTGRDPTSSFGPSKG